MAATYVKCTHTKGNRVQECIIVLVADRMALIPIGPSENAVGKIAGGLALTAVGVITIRLGSKTIDASQLATAEDLDAAIAASGGFDLGADWLYRTRVPIIGTMLMNGKEVITTRERVPAEMFARLTPNRTPPSAKVAKIVCAIGAAIIAVAVMVFFATDSIEALFGIGFWGLLLIGTSLFAWLRLRRVSSP
ncbi:MAG: hypothetical protein M4D80_24600 [Myxococcota bacterium]|nr:hypothetical protein [Myxococcota bacterium]